VTNDENTNAGYEVGYGKPPVDTRWKPGQSGNRSGKAKPGNATEGDNLFQKSLLELVEVQEDGRTVRITRKHFGVRRHVEGAAMGNMRSLKNLFRLGKAHDPEPKPEDIFVATLDESRACGPPERVLHDPGIQIIRQKKPEEKGAKEAASDTPAATRLSRRRRGRARVPRDQRFSTLVSFELARRKLMTDPATGKSRKMSMREAIVDQLTRAFANGDAGALRFVERLNSQSKVAGPKFRSAVLIPWDYEIPPPPPEGMRAWPKGSKWYAYGDS